MKVEEICDENKPKTKKNRVVESKRGNRNNTGKRGMK